MEEEDENEEEYDYSTLKGKTIVGVNPDKHSIIYMTSDGVKEHYEEVEDKEGNKKKRRVRLEEKCYLHYSSVQWRMEMKTQVYSKWKAKPERIQQLESSMKIHNSCTIQLDQFQSYLKAHFTIEEELYNYYGKRIHRIHQWWSCGNKQQSEAKLVERIKKTFDPEKKNNLVLAYGSWPGTSQMRGLYPLPVIGMRHLLERHFQVIAVPEAYTTKTCCHCMKQTMKEWKVWWWKKKKKMEDVSNEESSLEGLWTKEKVSIHGLCHCQNVWCGLAMNCNYNASINIQWNLLHCIETGSWLFSQHCEEEDNKGKWNKEEKKTEEDENDENKSTMRTNQQVMLKGHPNRSLLLTHDHMVVWLYDGVLWA